MNEDQALDLSKARRVRTSDDREDAPLFTDNPAPKSPHKLDAEPMVRLHSRLMSLYTQELYRQEENRREQAEDEDFYDNKQWRDEDADVLRERGQDPLTYNVISTAIDWILGTQRRMRTDFRVLPRRKDAGKAAERKTQLLKYLADINRTEFGVSRAFADAVKVGIGWLEDAVQDDMDGEPVYSRYESWRNILHDSAGTERDLTDCRYVFRTKWVDEDIAISMFPKRAGIIKETIDEGSRSTIDQEGDDPMDSIEDQVGTYNAEIFDADNVRRRVRLIEAWYLVPTQVKQIRGGQFWGEVHDPKSPGHREELQRGEAELVTRMTYRMHVAIMTSQGLLYAGESPYRHNRYPFTPIWGKVRGKDNLPYGAIRTSKDIQRDINKRAAKALHILSTNKTIMDEGAVDDIDEYLEEVSRPDAVIVKKSGKDLVLNAERDLAPAHLELMSRSIMMIQQTSGVTDENMGRQTNATSGRAIEARQDQGSLATSLYFDNLRFARQIQGEKQLALIEQFFDDVKQFRITNMRGTPEYITVNDGLPENDILRTKADFLISEDAWNATRRQAQVTEMMGLLNQLAPVAPQIVMATLDIVFESMDLPSREELVKRIRSITGMRDPDAEELTPEEIAQAQAQQAQQELQQRAMMADISKKEADALKAQSDARKADASVQDIMASLAGKNVAAQKAALETALMMLSAAPAVPVADQLLHESGFQSRTEQEETARYEGQLAAAEEQAAMEAAAQQQAEGEAQAQAEAQRQEREAIKAEVDPVQAEAMRQEEAAAAAAQQQQSQPNPQP